MSNSRTHLYYASALVIVAGMAATAYTVTTIQSFQMQASVAAPVAVQQGAAIAAPQPAPVVAQAPVQQIVQPATSLDTLEQAYMQPVNGLPADALNDKGKVAQIMQIMERLSFIEGKTKPAAGKQYAYIFFDPRCPYCHAAHTELDDKMPIRWVPIPLLGDDPLPLVTAILSNPTSDTLDKAFAGRLPSQTSADPAVAKTLFDNIDAFKTFMQSLNGEGVPILLIPRPDGTLFGQVGYSAGDGANVRAQYGA